MKSNRNRWTIVALAGALMAPAMLNATSATTSTPTYSVAAHAAQASELLREVRTLADQVSQSTDRLAVSLETRERSGKNRPSLRLRFRLPRERVSSNFT